MCPRDKVCHAALPRRSSCRGFPTDIELLHVDWRPRRREATEACVSRLLNRPFFVRSRQLIWDRLTVQMSRFKAEFQKTRRVEQGKAVAFQELDRRLLLSSVMTASSRPAPPAQVLSAGGTAAARTDATASALTAAESDRFALNSKTWTSIGPAPILHGQDPGHGPVTGRITGVAPDPANSNIIYIAAAGGGVWKTTNGGKRWVPLTDHVQSASGNPVPEALSALALASTNLASAAHGKFILYAGLDSEDSQGLLVSRDGGATWTVENDGGVFNGLEVTKIVVDQTDPTGQTVYAVMNNLEFAGTISGVPGIYKSTDGGTSWVNTTASISSDGTFTDCVVDSANGQVRYTAVGPPPYQQGASAIYKSTDGGGAWAELSGGAPSGVSAGSISLAISPSSPEMLIAVSTNPSTGAIQIERTPDGGTTWSNVTNDAPTGGAPYLVTVDPSNPNVVFIFGQASYNVETTNGGATWKNIAYDSSGHGPHVDNHSVDFDAAGNLLLGNDVGIWKLTRPTSLTNERWRDLNGNLDITQFYDVALDPRNAKIAYAGSQDNGTDKFQGSLGWDLLQGGDGGYARVDPSNSRTIYQEFYDVSLSRSDNGGKTFTSISPPGAGGDNSQFIIPFVLDPSDYSEILYGTDKLYESTNEGQTWTTVGSPGKSFNTSDSTIDAVAATGTGNSTMLYVMAGNSTYVSGNNGATWSGTQVPGYNDFHYSDPTLVIDPTNPEIAYAVRNMPDAPGTDPIETGHIFRTTDGGETWTDITSDLPNTALNAIAMNVVGGTTHLWVGTNLGVYESTNLGASWSLFGAGLPNATVMSLEYVPSLNTLVAGTYGRGAWEILDPGGARSRANTRG